MKKILSFKKGFSLIELLVVIAIIAILSAVVVVSISGSRSKARDAKRISDIAQIQLALEQYFDKCRSYPAEITVDSVTAVDGSCKTSTFKLSNFISVVPKDPLTKVAYYYAIATNGLDYVLGTQLETSSDVINDALNGFPTLPAGISFTPATFSSFSCSNVPANKSYCIGPK